MSPLPTPARKITTFSAGVMQVGERAPRVVRGMHVLDLAAKNVSLERVELDAGV